jgi:hypothetical protein
LRLRGSGGVDLQIQTAAFAKPQAAGVPEEFVSNFVLRPSSLIRFFEVSFFEFPFR